MAAMFALATLFVAGCGKDDTGDNPIKDPDAEAPAIERFWFDTRNNPRMPSNLTCRIDDATHAITATVEGSTPLIPGSCTLTPTFTVPEGQTVYVNGARQWSGVSRVDFSHPVTYRVENVNGEVAEYVVTLSFPFTGLPVVSISTASGLPVTSKDAWSKATITIDGVGQYDNISAADIEIAGRGNSTWGYPKKPYKFKFDKRTGVSACPMHKRWVLLASISTALLLLQRRGVPSGAAERSGVDTARRLRRTGAQRRAPRLLLSLRADPHRRKPAAHKRDARPMTRWRRVTTSPGGYILELDSYYDEENKFRSAVRDLPVNVNTPDEDDIGAPQFAYIRDYFNEAEKVLYGDNWLDEATGYKNYIDIESFADIYLISELIYHYEWIHPKSAYFYKDRGGKLCAGPMWDYDWLTFTQESGWHCRNYMWYPRLFEDPAFRAMLKERWRGALPVVCGNGGIYLLEERDAEEVGCHRPHDVGEFGRPQRR